MPDDFDKKLKAWKIANLPIIPPKFELKPVSTAKKKFQSLKNSSKERMLNLSSMHVTRVEKESSFLITFTSFPAPNFRSRDFGFCR
jgi:hypothetical protein